jgi:hypothetical protein
LGGSHEVNDGGVVSTGGTPPELREQLLTPEQVAEWFNVSPDWVRDHCYRKEPRLPVVPLGGGPGRAGLLRFHKRELEEFLNEMARAGRSRRRYNGRTPPKLLM